MSEKPLIIVHTDTDGQVIGVVDSDRQEIPYMLESAPVDADFGPFNMTLYKGTTDSVCNNCCKEGAHFSCAHCGYALYCNESCQSQDWAQDHGKVCNTIRSYVGDIADHMGVAQDQVPLEHRRAFRAGFRMLAVNSHDRGNGGFRRQGEFGPEFRPWYRGYGYPLWYYPPIVPGTILTLAALKTFLTPRRYALYQPYWRYNFSTRNWTPRYNPGWDPYIEDVKMY